MSTALLVSVPASPSPHLGEAEIAGYLDRDIGPDDRVRVEAHLDECGECRRAVFEVRRISDGFAELRTKAQEEAKSAFVRETRPWRARRVAAVGAVALAASLMIVVFGRNGAEMVREVERAPGASESRGAVSAVLPADGAVVTVTDLTFTWRARAGSVFRVAVLDESGAPLFVQETTDTMLALPQTANLEVGKSYFWRVDVLADGITASTIARRFTVAP